MRKKKMCVELFSMLIAKLRFSLDRWTIRCLESKLDCQAQRVVFSNKTFRWWPVTSGVPRELILGLILFNILINELEMR